MLPPASKARGSWQNKAAEKNSWPESLKLPMYRCSLFFISESLVIDNVLPRGLNPFFSDMNQSMRSCGLETNSSATVYYIKKKSSHSDGNITYIQGKLQWKKCWTIREKKKLWEMIASLIVKFETQLWYKEYPEKMVLCSINVRMAQYHVISSVQFKTWPRKLILVCSFPSPWKELSPRVCSIEKRYYSFGQL